MRYSFDLLLFCTPIWRRFKYKYVVFYFFFPHFIGVNSTRVRRSSFAILGSKDSQTYTDYIFAGFSLQKSSNAAVSLESAVSLAARGLAGGSFPLLLFFSTKKQRAAAPTSPPSFTSFIKLIFFINNKSKWLFE